jgi:hypothetical protein
MELIGIICGVILVVLLAFGLWFISQARYD